MDFLGNSLFRLYHCKWMIKYLFIFDQAQCFFKWNDQLPRIEDSKVWNYLFSHSNLMLRFVWILNCSISGSDSNICINKWKFHELNDYLIKLCPKPKSIFGWISSKVSNHCKIVIEHHAAHSEIRQITLFDDENSEIGILTFVLHLSTNKIYSS